MGEVKIYDNFLPEADFITLQNILTGPEFPWFYQQYIDKEPDENSIPDLNRFYFSHLLYGNNSPRSNYFPILDSLVKTISPLALCRIKANLNTRTDKIIQYGYHIDFDVKSAPVKTAVYYINTNNGATVFETGEKVTSQENRLVIFDSHMKHAGTSCTDEQARILINLNYIEW